MNSLVTPSITSLATPRGITPVKIQQPKTRNYRGRGMHSAPDVVESLTDWLRSCPEKDYFVAVQSDSTDSL